MGFSFFCGKQDRLRQREKHALRNGFGSGVMRLQRSPCGEHLGVNGKMAA